MVKEGIVLYSIELDGCLNGVYTNELAGGVICNEIAKKEKAKEEAETDPICGTYKCMFFESTSRHWNVFLEVTAPNNSRVYEFNWTEKGVPTFKGIGYKMNERHIAVRYKSV